MAAGGLPGGHGPFHRLLLGQTFAVGKGSQFEAVVEARTLSISNRDTAAKASDIEEDGYYLGGQYKSPLRADERGRSLFSYFAGGGLGAYGAYVKHVDAHVGAGFGYNGRLFSPFAAAAVGFSLPYARKMFSHVNPGWIGRAITPEKYRFATAAWLA